MIRCILTGMTIWAWTLFTPSTVLGEWCWDQAAGGWVWYQAPVYVCPPQPVVANGYHPQATTYPAATTYQPTSSHVWPEYGRHTQQTRSNPRLLYDVEYDTYGTDEYHSSDRYDSYTVPTRRNRIRSQNSTRWQTHFDDDTPNVADVHFASNVETMVANAANNALQATASGGLINGRTIAFVLFVLFIFSAMRGGGSNSGSLSGFAMLGVALLVVVFLTGLVTIVSPPRDASPRGMERETIPRVEFVNY